MISKLPIHFPSNTGMRRAPREAAACLSLMDFQMTLAVEMKSKPKTEVNTTMGRLKSMPRYFDARAKKADRTVSFTR